MNGIFNDIVSLLQATILVVAALFPIVNPIGSAAVFLAMVDRFNPDLQRLLSKKIAIHSFFLLFLSMFCGSRILSFFGISLYSVQVGGGLIVVSNGWLLLTDGRQSGATVPTPKDVLAQAFYPFTLPITVGPGSISVAVAVGAHLHTQLKSISIVSPSVLVVQVIGALILSFTIYLCYRWARAAGRLLGDVGTTVLMRLSSFILLCIGVQIVAGGIRGYVATLH